MLLLGGLGVVGRILEKGLANKYQNKYELVLADRKPNKEVGTDNYVQIDVTNFSQLMERIPDDIDVMVNLTGLPEENDIVNEQAINLISNLYIVGTYNVFLAAAYKRIPKVIFASTNHVTESYEVAGASKLGREIRPSDYPDTNSVYGAMKLCGEQFGRIFSRKYGISVVCLRIGTVREDELDILQKDQRARRTILSKLDTVGIFKSAIESDVEYGIYYAVSDNPGRPWSIKEAVAELGYRPRMNSEMIINQSKNP